MSDLLSGPEIYIHHIKTVPFIQLFSRHKNFFQKKLDFSVVEC